MKSWPRWLNGISRGFSRPGSLPDRASVAIANWKYLCRGWQQRGKILCSLALLGLILLGTSACGVSTRVSAQERLFLDLSLELVDTYTLPKQSFEGTTVGGLSAIAYDSRSSQLYALSDARDRPRFYTLKLALEPETPKIATVAVEGVTFLRDEAGNVYPPDTVDPEGLAIAPGNTIFVSSEGVVRGGSPPFVRRFDLETGQAMQSIGISDRYLPLEGEKRGLRDNLGFEALGLGMTGRNNSDPFRVFFATESAIAQDVVPPEAEQQTRVRFLHYLVNPFGDPTAVAEHVYLMEPTPVGSISNGLTEMRAIREGHFLFLERTFGVGGFGAKIFQVAAANATDTSRIESLKGDLGQVQPLRKQLLLNLGTLGIKLDNLEGMTLGPPLPPDGSPSLLLISDDNFNENQETQLLLFRLLAN